MGLIFEEDPIRKRVLVGGYLEGSNAEQRARQAKLNPALAAAAPQEGKPESRPPGMPERGLG